MNDDNLIVSGFDPDIVDVGLLPVDFAKATKLDREGSTCDSFECTIQRRRVFVKRLKAEYLNNPVYRAAFEKEYDLGVSLSHPSLPHYVGYGDGYIAMDFIEGDTLADLIKHGDQRLKDKKFIIKLLSELIDVVEYLHYRNIIHCDIKADNILISPYKERPAILLDLDKAYTTWLDSTPGDPSKYDCEECSDGKIDFHGIGKIAERLGLKRFASICYNNDATFDLLRRSLRHYSLRSRFVIWGFAIIVAVLCAIAFLVITRNNAKTELQPPEVVQPNDSVSIEVNAESHAPEITSGEKDLTPDEKDIESSEANPDAGKESAATSRKKSSDDIAQELESIVRQHYNTKLYRRQEYLRKLATDPKATAAQLQTIFTSYANDQMKAQNDIMSKVVDLYGLSNPFEAPVVLSKSKEWGRFMKEDFELNKLYTREIEKRKSAKDSLR